MGCILFNYCYCRVSYFSHFRPKYNLLVPTTYLNIIPGTLYFSLVPSTSADHNLWYLYLKSLVPSTHRKKHWLRVATRQWVSRWFLVTSLDITWRWSVQKINSFHVREHSKQRAGRSRGSRRPPFWVEVSAGTLYTYSTVINTLRQSLAGHHYFIIFVWCVSW